MILIEFIQNRKSKQGLSHIKILYWYLVSTWKWLKSEFNKIHLKKNYTQVKQKCFLSSCRGTKSSTSGN